MTTLLVAFDEVLVTARRAQHWHLEEALVGEPLTCLAADPTAPGRVYCGTERGLWRSDDGGGSWRRIGSTLPVQHVTAVALNRTATAPIAPAQPVRGPAAVYAGTEPSHLCRSTDGGETWVELAGLAALPSREEWSFPPRPHTLATHPGAPGRLYSAAGDGTTVTRLASARPWVTGESSGGSNPSRPDGDHNRSRGGWCAQ